MQTTASDVDEVAVQRAVDGDRPDHLTRSERLEALRVLHGRGTTYEQMHRRLGVSAKQINRDLNSLGLINSETEVTP